MILIAPILIPLAAAAMSLAAWRSLRWQRIIAAAAGAVLLAAAGRLLTAVSAQGVLVLQAGNWPAPFGIALVADMWSAVMVALTAVAGGAVIAYSLASVDDRLTGHGYYPLVQALLAGVAGAFLTGDLFNLYVWFEVMLIASFVLLALQGGREQMEGAIKYVSINLVSSAFFLAAAGLLYGALGTLNMADLGRRIGQMDDPGRATVAVLLLMAAFGIKAAIFPLFFWLPAAYHVPPVAISALFAGLLAKVGVYALGRVFAVMLVEDAEFPRMLLLIAGTVTMVVGVFGAAVQQEIRRILAFHSVSQIGYIVLGLALFTPLAIASAIYFILHHSIVKMNLFFIAGVVARLRGTERLARLGSLAGLHAGLATLFLVTALSLAGIPPLSGFFAKLGIIRAGLEESAFIAVAAALAVSLLTLYSMTKIWQEAFWKPAPEDLAEAPPLAPATDGGRRVMMTVCAAFTVLTVALGLAAQQAMEITTAAAEQLLDRGAYIQAVLGGAR